MNIASILGSPLLGLVSMFAPQAAPVIALLQRFAPAIGAGVDVVQAAIKEGVPAFEAAKAQAPELAAAAEALFEQFKTRMVTVPADLHLENITRMLANVHPMTPEEEKIWMDRATPGNDPSQENSKFTVG